MSKIKLPYETALSLAKRVALELSPATTRIEIAGSIRRKRPEIGDIEIVCTPFLQVNLFGDPQGSLLDLHLEQLAESGRIIKSEGEEKRWGPKYKKFHPVAKPDLAIDLFITTPEEWAYTFVIRTGNADFSHKLVTPKRYGGYLPGHLRVAGCRLWEGDKALETPEEEDFFKALGLEWVKPEDRV